MITSDTDPRDDRFHLFLREAAQTGEIEVTIPERIDRLAGAARAVAEAVEAQSPPADLARWTLALGGWALSPGPSDLEPWAIEALHRIRRDPIRARNVARGVVDWVTGQLRARVADLRTSWQVLHDSSFGYPFDPETTHFTHPAQASGDVVAWSYALLRAAVARHARGLRTYPTTLADAARAGRSRN